MTILCDIDSVLNDQSKVLLDILNAKHHTSYAYSDITYWNWFNDHFENPWQELKDRSFWDSLTINLEAVTVLEQCALRGDKVYLVTASSFTDTLGYKICKTLEAFNPDLISQKNVIVAYDKGAIQGDVIIDDGIHNLEQSNAPIKICYMQPWNKDWKGMSFCNWYFLWEYLKYSHIKPDTEIKMLGIDKN